jgi:DNA-binding SARP family transcriptional activator/WD40 repeat protein
MHYGVLGPLEARVDGELVAVGGPQQRRVLALLLQRSGHPVSTDRMVNCLWADGEAPDGAARSVMTYVSRLRSVLGEDSIERRDDGYRLVLNGSSLDAGEFEACLSEAASAEPGRAMELYDRALGLWRGEAYGDLGHEWWLLAEANRLNEMRLVGMEQRAEVMVLLGQDQRAIPELNWMRATNPLRERPVALLMQALSANGRQADALREFQTYRATLADETGLDPSAELQALERSIAAGTPSASMAGRLRPLRGYQIQAVLGEGAFGRVLAATQPGTNREVAIKVIRPDLADDARFVQRFEAEAQLVARVEHPHIVPLYDYWREPGGAFLVFRLLTGGTAQAALVSGGAFDVSSVSRIVEEVGSALLAAHTAGVIHGDLKPSNVMFDAAGNSYLTDFGIALASNLGQVDQRSRGYEAPELADRTGDTVRSDIFGFGCMLWELLAGESPQAAASEGWQRPGAARVPSLAGRISASNAAIDAVIARATEPDPAKRYESMAELIVAWRAAVGRQDGVLTPVDEPAGSFTSARRRAASTLAAEVSASVNPYKGLRSFTESDADDFFGRDAVAVALREALVVRRFVAIVGPSGSGKSSVVHAGLVPLLRDEGTRIATMVPGERPFDALRQALRSVATSDATTSDDYALIDSVVADGASDLVLVVDQFEECWTLAGAAERERFLGAIAHSLARHVRCVVTVRADLYDRPLRHQLIGPLMADGTFPLPPLGTEAIEEAVVQPARRNGVEFDEGVATTIVAEAAAHPAGLPLLQFALVELYERRVHSRITARSLHELGGIGGAVGRRAEETYLALPDELRPHARALFGRLVAPGLGAPDTRRRARLGELSQPARETADRFVQARLLVADRDLASREPVFEVAHEALLSNWPRLRDWLISDRDWISQLQHVSTAAGGWRGSGNAEGELYRGSRLEAILEVLAERGDELNEDERAFVEASRQARDADRDRERRTNRRLRRLLTAAVCLLVVAMVAGVLAFSQRRAADSSRRGAEITTLASQSLSMRPSNKDAAALLAVEANRLRSDSASMSALFATFTREPGFVGYRMFDGANVHGAVVPNTNLVVFSVGSGSDLEPDAPLRTMDLVSGEVVTVFEPIGSDDHIVGVVASSDGRVAVAYGSQFVDGSMQPVQVVGFDVATGRSIRPPIQLEQAVDYNVAVNADGTQVAVGGGPSGDVRIFDLRTGAQLTTFAPPLEGLGGVVGGDTSAAAWAPDGRLFVGSTGGHLRVFDPSTFELVLSIAVPGLATGGLLEFSDDARFVIARGVAQYEGGTAAGAMARIDIPSARVVWQLSPFPGGDDGCGVFAFSDAENRLWCGDETGVIRGRSLITGVLDDTTIEYQRGDLWGIDLASVGGHEVLVSFGAQAAAIGRWRVDGTGPIGHNVDGSYDYADYSPDGRWLLVGSPSDSAPGYVMSVLDADTDRRMLTFPADVTFAAWLDDERVGGVTATGVVRAYDVVTGAVDYTRKIEPGFGTARRVADGKLVFWYLDGRVEVWDIAGDHRIELRRSKEVGSPPTTAVGIAGSSDGTHIYVSGGGLWEFDATTGEQIRWIADPGIYSVAAAADGALAVGHTDGTITLHDPDDLSEIGTLPGARSLVDVSYDAAGDFLLAQTIDGTISLYDVERRERVGDPIVIANVGKADLRPDGLELAVAQHTPARVTLWTLDPAALSDAACAVAGRNLTRAEWDTYIGDLAPYHATCPQYPVPSS